MKRERKENKQKKTKTYLVTLLSSSSNTSSPLVLRFSLITTNPSSPRRLMASPHRFRYPTSWASVKCPTHHCVHTKSYPSPSLGGVHSSNPQLYTFRTQGARSRKPEVNLATGSMTSMVSAREVKRPVVMRPIPAPPSRARDTVRWKGFVPRPSLARKFREPWRSTLEMSAEVSKR